MSSQSQLRGGDIMKDHNKYTLRKGATASQILSTAAQYNNDVKDDMTADASKGEIAIARAMPTFVGEKCPMTIIAKNGDKEESIRLRPGGKTFDPEISKKTAGINYFAKRADGSLVQCVPWDSKLTEEEEAASEAAQKEAARVLTAMASMKMLDSKAKEFQTSKQVEQVSNALNLMNNSAVAQGMKNSIKDRKLGLDMITMELSRLARANDDLKWLESFGPTKAADKEKFDTDTVNPFALAIVQCALADDEEDCASDKGSQTTQYRSKLANSTMCKILKVGKKKICVPKITSDNMAKNKVAEAKRSWDSVAHLFGSKRLSEDQQKLRKTWIRGHHAAQEGREEMLQEKIRKVKKSMGDLDGEDLSGLFLSDSSSKKKEKDSGSGAFALAGGADMDADNYSVLGSIIGGGKTLRGGGGVPAAPARVTFEEDDTLAAFESLLGGGQLSPSEYSLFD